MLLDTSPAAQFWANLEALAGWILLGLLVGVIGVIVMYAMNG